MKTEKLSDYQDSVYNRKRRSYIWHSVKIADSMREEGVPQGISVLRRKHLPATHSQLTVPEIALISRNVGIAGFLMGQNALNATSARPLRRPSATTVQSASNRVGITT